MYFASLPPEEIYDRRGDIICAIAQWSMMIQAVITTERQDRASENPDGTPRQCISVCPWKLAQPIAGYRRSTNDPYPQRQKKKRIACSFSYLFCCDGALCTILEFYLFVLRELGT